MLSTTLVKDQKVTAAGKVNGLLDAVIRRSAVVASRPMGVEFAILACIGVGVHLDLLEFDDVAGDRGPVRDARRVGPPRVRAESGQTGATLAEVAVLDQ